MNLISEVNASKEDFFSNKPQHGDQSLQDIVAINTSYMRRLSFNMQDHQELNMIQCKIDDEPCPVSNKQQRNNLSPTLHGKKDMSIKKGQNKSQQISQSEINNSKVVRINKLKKILSSANTVGVVKQFAQNLMRNQRIFSKITQKVIDAINDQSYFNEQHGNRYNKFLLVWFRKLEAQLPVFLPYNRTRVMWDIAQAFLIICVLFTQSLLTFFQMKNNMQVISILVMIIFITDTILNFNTAFLSKGTVITVRREITKKYFKDNFLWDIMAFFSLSKNINDGADSVQDIQFFGLMINLMIFFKMFSFFEVSTRISAYFTFTEKQKNILDLLKLFATLLTVMHVFGCIWHFVALFEIQVLKAESNTWLHSKGLQNDGSLYSHYIYSVYYLAVTMISIGYGDITPQNPVEVTVALFIMFTTGLTFAYTINAIGNILQNIKEKSQKIKQDLEIVSQLMIRENLNSQLRMRISNYIVHMHSEQNMAQRAKELEVVNRLSSSLQNEINYEISSKLLSGIEFIVNNFSVSTVEQTINIMEECGFNAGDTIFEQCSDNYSLYLILSGEVHMYVQNNDISNKTILKSLTTKQTFGQYEFFTGFNRRLSACAVTYSRLFKVSRQQFIEILKKNKNDFEIFCQIRDRLIHQQEYPLINLQCYQCQKTDHLVNNCPLTHMEPEKDGLIARNCFSLAQERKSSYNRRQKAKKMFNSLRNIQQTQLDAIELLDSESMCKAMDDIMKDFSECSVNSEQQSPIALHSDEEESQYSIFDTPQLPPLEKHSSMKMIACSLQLKRDLEQNANTLQEIPSHPQEECLFQRDASKELSIKSNCSQKDEPQFQQQQSTSIQSFYQPTSCLPFYQTCTQSQSQQQQQNCDKSSLNNEVRSKNKKSSFLLQDHKRQSLTPQVMDKVRASLQKQQQQSQEIIKTQRSKQFREDQTNISNKGETSLEMELMKEFTSYLPHNNFSNVLEELRLLRIPIELRLMNQEVKQKKKKNQPTLIDNNNNADSINQKVSNNTQRQSVVTKQSRISMRQSLNFSLLNMRGSRDVSVIRPLQATAHSNCNSAAKYGSDIFFK